MKKKPFERRMESLTTPLTYHNDRETELGVQANPENSYLWAPERGLISITAGYSLPRGLGGDIGCRHPFEKLGMRNLPNSKLKKESADSPNHTVGSWVSPSIKIHIHILLSGMPDPD